MIYGFDTIIWIKEPNYGNTCLSLCMLAFKKNSVFDKWDATYQLLINDSIVLLDLCCLKTCEVRILSMKFICMYLWDVIINDVVIDDNVI